jgi:hypothetical protein
MNLPTLSIKGISVVGIPGTLVFALDQDALHLKDDAANGVVVQHPETRNERGEERSH